MRTLEEAEKERMQCREYSGHPTHVFHKIRIPGRASKYSAWFCGDPRGRASSLATLVDAERIDSRGRSYPVTHGERSALLTGPWSAGQVATFNLTTGSHHA